MLIASLQIEQPAFELDLARLQGFGKKKTETPGSLPKQAASLLAVLASKAPDLDVKIENGRLDLVDGKEPVLSLRDLDASLVLPPMGPEFKINCQSNLWQDLSIQGGLDAKTLTGEGRLEFSRFQPHLLADRFFPNAGIACSESILYLRADVRTEGLRTFHGEVKTSVPRMTFSRAGEESALEIRDLGITFSVEEDRISASLDRLQMDAPRLSMSGTFEMDRAASDVRLELEARDLDVDSARKAALCMGGNIRVVRDIFDYVRGGEVPAITFRSRAPALDHLGKDEAFRIEGRMQDGRIHIRGPGLDLEEVNGEVVISHGILEGEGLEARLGNSRGHGGRLRVGLKGKDAPFHLEIGVDADMAEVRPILMRVIKPGTFVRELSLVNNIDGRCVGRMTLGENLQSVEAKVDVSQCRMSAEYRRIPYSIRFDGGEVSYETGSIGGRDMSGTLGKSSFSGLAFRIGFGDSPHLEIESGRFRLFMDEIYPWLLSYESIRRDLELFRDIKGWIDLTGARLTGPVLKPADWDFAVQAAMENVTVDTRLCPEPVPVASGRLEATPEKLGFKDVEAVLLDASAVASGTLHGYLQGLGTAEVDLRGRIGAKASQWLSDTIRLPDDLRVRTPFALENATLVWARDGQDAFKGDFTFPEGTRASLDLLLSPGEFILRSVSVEDADSRATSSVTRTGDTLGLKFTGNLNHPTLDRIFVHNVVPEITLKGDFLLDIRLDKPAFSKAQGHLEAADFTVPYGWMAPFRFEGLSLDASERGIRVDSAHLLLDESHLSLQGDLGFSPEGIQVEMDLDSDGIDWDTIERVIDRAEGEEAADRESPSPWPWIGGTVRCSTETFTYGQFTWKPLLASVTFSPDDLRVAVTEADICGISTLGALKSSREGLSLDFKLIAKDGNLEPAFPCLSDTQRQVTGRFDLRGELTGVARGDAVVRALQGDLEFSASNGSILRDPVLAKVFSVLNVTEILRGKVPDLISNKLPYDSMTIKARLQDGSLLLSEATLSGPTVGIAGNGTVNLIDKEVDLKLIVAPLRTVDFIVERTPVVSNIMGGKLITVPVRISGDWKDPSVTMLSAAAVGSRLLEIMKNTLTLPVDLVEAGLPKQGEEKKNSP